MEGEIHRRFKGLAGAWSGSYWDIYRTYQMGAIEAWAIPTDTGGDYSAWNFLACHWNSKRGEVVIDAAGNRYHTEQRCGRPACWHCDDVARTKTARTNIEAWTSTIERNPGAAGTLHIVWTLPAGIEAAPLASRADALAVKGAIDRIIKRIFGRQTVRGRRSNLAYNLAVHPVGDRDIGRGRWHAHTDILPCEFIKTEGDPQLFWLAPRPSWTAARHTAEKWRLDLARIRGAWAEELQAIFPFADLSSLANPQVRFISVADPKFEAKLRHTLDYNYRSFSRDMEKATLRANHRGRIIITKGRAKGWQFWRHWTAAELAERFRWIKSQNRIQSKGWLHQRKKYKELGFLSYQDEEIPDQPAVDLRPVQAEISTTIERRRDPESGRFYWHSERVWTFFNPQKQELESIDQWGRGSGTDPPLLPWIWPRLLIAT
jgi:hypothetical protein